MTMQQVDESLIHLQCRLAASEDNEKARPDLPQWKEQVDFFNDLLGSHLGEGVELCIAERAMQVTACKTHKNRSTPCVAAFALQRVEDIIDAVAFQLSMIHYQLSIPYSVHLIAGHVTLALLYGALIALRNLLCTPSGDILSSRIERQHIVQILVVEAALDAFHLSEIYHHPVLIQFFRAAIDGDYPVVAVQLCALALVIYRQPMAGGDLHGLLYVVHFSLMLGGYNRFPAVWPVCRAAPWFLCVP